MEGGGGGRLFEAEHLLTFSAFRTDAYSNKYGKHYFVCFLLRGLLLLLLWIEREGVSPSSL